MNVEPSMCASSGEAAQWEQIDWSKCEQPGQEAASAYRKGNTGRPLGQGESLAMAADPLVLRQSLGRETSDGKSRQEHAGSGRSNLEHSGGQTQGHRVAATSRISAAAAAARLYPESQWKAETAGHPHDEGPRHAGVVPAGAWNPIAETDCRSQLLRLPTETLHRRCHRTVLQGAVPRRISAQWVLEGDIKGCFDHISHEWMLDHIPTDKEVLRKWLKAGYIENRTLFPTEAGTPQGGIISPDAGEPDLDGLERLLKETLPQKEVAGRKRYNPKVNLVRYADDFIITGGSKELLENEVRPLVEQFLHERGLQLSPDKTRITHIERGVRLPRTEPAQVRRQAPDETVEEEHARVLGEGPGDDSHESRNETGASDWAAEPGHSWLGKLSPSHRGRSTFRKRDGPLAVALAMGQTQTSEQDTRLGRKSILAPAGTEHGASLHDGLERATVALGLGSAGESNRNPHPALCQGRSRTPIRSTHTGATTSKSRKRFR